ncbi:MAG: WD40/YVTN/BNR-like repeat-containing protein, partial [Gaiellaceae bacterium]
MAPAILVGTRKGLFVLKGDEGRRDWEVEGPYLSGWDVFHAVKDDSSIFAAANHAVYGATVQRSDDGGKTWERSEGLRLPEDHELTLEKTWHVEPGPDGTLWLGAAPGVLFRSSDRGESWEPVLSLIDHPTRDRWNPGAGGMCTHSIQIDPADPQTMYVGISAAGV